MSAITTDCLDMDQEQEALVMNEKQQPDHWVTVCSACRCASCWHGEFMCQQSRDASTTDALASTLLAEDREHPSHFSVERLREVCGDVRYAS